MNITNFRYSGSILSVVRFDFPVETTYVLNHIELIKQGFACTYSRVIKSLQDDLDLAFFRSHEIGRLVSLSCDHQLDEYGRECRWGISCYFDTLCLRGYYDKPGHLWSKDTGFLLL